MERSELTELSRLSLFTDMTRDELTEAMDALHPRWENYSRNQVILQAGGHAKDLYVIVSGSVRMELIDRLGARSIAAVYQTGQVFGLTPAALDRPMAASAVANESCRILLLDRSAMDVPRSHWRPWLFLLTRNLLEESCRNALMYADREALLAPKRARDRLEAYLSQVWRETGALDFFIPFDQQQLADYLNLDRSVVSKELNKIKRDGLLWFSRNHFILQPDTEITADGKK